MQYRLLGHTDIRVSVICLGTMTWGTQNTRREAHQQLDYAVAQGVNFIDTAEMYPVPYTAEKHGVTETYLGAWLAQRNDRDRLIIATKMMGSGMTHTAHDGARLTREHILRAADASLRRLQTDYIDLYQVHWPARRANFFGKLGYVHADEQDTTPIAETLAALSELVRAGKVRYTGVSNETPWGVMEYLRQSERVSQARIVSVQNPYNLLNRTFEIGLAEVAHREKVGLLAYSPLGFGVLSGKYLKRQAPPNARLTLYPQFKRYTSVVGVQTTAGYARIAAAAGMEPATMALAYINTRSFLTANIIGATTIEQLEKNIASIDVVLGDDVLTAIEAQHQVTPNPCP